jgi:hypothetical protein
VRPPGTAGVGTEIFATPFTTVVIVTASGRLPAKAREVKLVTAVIIRGSGFEGVHRPRREHPEPQQQEGQKDPVHGPPERKAP